jgi:protein-L-isoaspartate(D-aspartate) O-methyltransferase
VTGHLPGFGLLCSTRVILILSTAGLLAAADPYAADRERMVREQIEGRGIHSAELLRVLRATPRHLFVPIPERAMAYEDHPVPIGHGATISQPYIVAWMTDLLGPRKTDRVLEIGTGSGYQAAVLAQLAGRVYTMEIVAELAKSARDVLDRLGYSNVTVRQGDGYKGWPEEAPFDKIMVTAAPPDVPQALLDQLAKGGRLVTPVGRWLDQKLIVVEKDEHGRICREAVGDVLFVPLRPGGP